MADVKIIRLMNCAQVRVNHLGADFDIRAQCVDVIQRGGNTVVAMTTLYSRDADAVRPIEPILMGKITIPGEVTVIDAADLDFSCWSIEGANLTISVRPHQSEEIWVDHSFAGGELPQELAALYEHKRLYMSSIIAHRRFLRALPADKVAYRQIHESMLEQLTTEIRRIDRQIALKESSREQRTPS